MSQHCHLWKLIFATFILLLTMAMAIFLLKLSSDQLSNNISIFKKRFKKLSGNRSLAKDNHNHHMHCSMGNCFNFSKCMEIDDFFKIYIYPDVEGLYPSSIYSNIMKVLKETHYVTTDPDKACIFFLSFDTMDRDRISENYVKNIGSKIASLPKNIWNDGSNHLIFNSYFGTYPDYANNDLGFDAGKAMMAWASSSRQNFRRGFDISLPLFHKQHPLKKEGNFLQLHMPGHDRYLVSFKGKRYVYGIGSETRDILHHLHNNDSMIMATTCRHNSDWKKFEDERCVKDNAEYDRWDYSALMDNSTFCLIPRGRRLASFRFIESLRSACIPVVLSDDWVLPFEEIIDWSEAVINGNEKNVLFIYDYLSNISEVRVFKMRLTVQKLYHDHFSSIERIVLTTLEMLMERLNLHLGVYSRRNCSHQL